MYHAANILYRAGGRTLLDNAHVTVQPGRVTVLIGANGAGKSTLLKILAGEIRPAAGTVELDGTPLARMTPRAIAHRRAVLSQSVQVAFPFSVAEIVALGAQQVDPARIRTALARVDMLAFHDKPYGRLSGGEMQRVQIARTLVQLQSGQGKTERPRYVLLDEPTASLDLSHQRLIIRLARELAAEGVGVLAILHDLNLAVMAADHIVALRAGRVVAEGSGATVLNDESVVRIFGVKARVGWAPDTPFLLPQSVEI